MLILACSYSFNNLNSTDYIIGEWCLNVHQINYPSIQFTKDKTLLLKSLGDTIYRYQYYIKDHSLFIRKGNKTTKIRIMKLTKDSLILNCLLENKSIQKYSRCYNNHTTH